MKHNKQQGGTLLGIVIGLVLGLAIALGVAMVITKTPMPFTDKVGRAATPTATLPPDTDPNLPLYRKRNLPAPAAEIAPPANTATPAPAAKQGGVTIEERSAPAVGAAEGEKWQYFLQAGAFSELHDAESMRAKLALIDVQAQVSEHQAATGLLYRVRTGPYEQTETLNRVRARLTENGILADVVRISR